MNTSQRNSVAYVTDSLLLNTTTIRRSRCELLMSCRSLLSLLIQKQYDYVNCKRILAICHKRTRGGGCLLGTVKHEARVQTVSNAQLQVI